MGQPGSKRCVTRPTPAVVTPSKKANTLVEKSDAEHGLDKKRSSRVLDITGQVNKCSEDNHGMFGEKEPDLTLAEGVSLRSVLTADRAHQVTMGKYYHEANRTRFGQASPVMLGWSSMTKRSWQIQSCQSG
mgnify:CR=1 FL=1